MTLPEDQILLGDCLDHLRRMPDESIDACVCDPPYGLGTKEPKPEEILAYLQGASELNAGGDFMGKKWTVPSVAVWREVFRVLKPGGHLLAFGGTRTWDLISMGIRMAGFENRDTVASYHPALTWNYATGMPKSTNVSKSIDRMAGAEREVVGVNPAYHSEGKRSGTGTNPWGGHNDGSFSDPNGAGVLTAPATSEAKEWEGWGTALKPSWEPILVFRKPFKGTLVKNVLTHGTGALNIDASRVAHGSPDDLSAHQKSVEQIKAQGGVRDGSWKNSSDLSGANDVNLAGRWPANAILSHSPECQKVGTKQAKRFGSISGDTDIPFKSYRSPQDDGLVDGKLEKRTSFKAYGEGSSETVDARECAPGCPVAAFDQQSGRRPSTLTGRANPAQSHSHPGTEFNPNSTFLGERSHHSNVYADNGGASRFFKQFQQVENPFFYSTKASRKEAGSGEFKVLHPTLKPLKLMQYLIKLVTPPGGVVLDPYCGSGTTCHSALLEGFRYIGIERDEVSHAEATKRLDVARAANADDLAARDMYNVAMGGDDADEA